MVVNKDFRKLSALKRYFDSGMRRIRVRRRGDKYGRGIEHRMRIR